MINISYHGKHFSMVNLSMHFNNDGISYDTMKCDGAFEGFGSTYPAEELPDSNSIILLDNIPFIFPSKEEVKNNMAIKKQTFNIYENKYVKCNR